MDSFVTEISNVFGEEASANVFNIDSDNVQFSIQSLETGFDNRIQFSGATGVLSEITSGLSELVPDEEPDASSVDKNIYKRF